MKQRVKKAASVAMRKPKGSTPATKSRNLVVKRKELFNGRKKPKVVMDDSAEEDDSDEEEYDSDGSVRGQVHQPPEKLEVASDEEDFEEDEERVSKAKVTLKMVSEWTEGLKEKKGEELFKTMQDVVDAFLAAVESASSKVEAVKPKKKRKGAKAEGAEEEGEKKALRSKYFVNANNIFNAVVQLCLLEFLPAVNGYLKMPVRPSAGPAAGRDRDAAKAKVRQLTASKGWKRMAGLTRSYSKAVFRLLGCLGDSDALVAVLKHVHQLAPYFLASERVSLSKAFLKTLVGLWSSSSSDPARLLAFMSILRVVRNESTGVLDWTMKAMYKSYVKNCKFAQTRDATKWISFMKRTMTELYGLNEALAYRHAFIYIRQLAIHLRNATTLKNKNAKDAVLNWQYLHCLAFWGHALGAISPSDVLSPLIYPLTQVTIGTLSVADSPKFYPMRFHCVRILVELGRRTGTYIPTLPYAMDLLTRIAGRVREKGGPGSGTAANAVFDLPRLLKVSAGQVTHRAYLDACFESTYGLLLESLYSVCHSVAFPEIVFPTCNQLRRIAKKLKVGNYSKRLKLMLEKVNENAKFIEGSRSRQKISLSDPDSIRALETQLEQSGKSPFSSFYESWKSESDKREALLRPDEEISPETLKEKLRLKREEKREEAAAKRMEEQRKKDRRELKGLFLGSEDQDDAEEEAEEEAPKKRKKKKAKQAVVDDVELGDESHTQAAKKRKVEKAPLSASTMNAEDVVEDLKVSDFEASSDEEEEGDSPELKRARGSEGAAEGVESDDEDSGSDGEHDELEEDDSEDDGEEDDDSEDGDTSEGG